MKGFMTREEAKKVIDYFRKAFVNSKTDKEIIDEFDFYGWINPTIIESAKGKVEDTVETIKDKWSGEEGEKVRDIAKDVAGKAKKTFTNFLEKIKEIDEVLDKEDK